MGKIVRKSLPLEVSVGLLLLIFILSFLLAGQIFGEHNEGKNLYFGMLLVSTAVIIMVLVLWEELFFPVKVKPEQGEVVFRNHRTKLIIQVLIYFTIPAIFAFIYFNYEVNQVRFLVWAGIGIVVPVVSKLISGINNYNDFLKLTESIIEYKNNEKVGSFEVKQIQHLTLIKDERNVLHKLQLTMTNSNSVIIDLDEMELDAFCDTIDQYITIHYKNLIK